MGQFVIKIKNQTGQFEGKELELQVPIPGTDELDKARKLVRAFKQKEEPKGLEKLFKRKKKKASEEGMLRRIPALLGSIIMIATDEK